MNLHNLTAGQWMTIAGCIIGITSPFTGWLLAHLKQHISTASR